MRLYTSSVLTFPVTVTSCPGKSTLYDVTPVADNQPPCQHECKHILVLGSEHDQRKLTDHVWIQERSGHEAPTRNLSACSLHGVRTAFAVHHHPQDHRLLWQFLPRQKIHTQGTSGGKRIADVILVLVTRIT